MMLAGHLQLDRAGSRQPTFGPFKNSRLKSALQAERTIYIGNVASDADEYTLRSIFETCGQVTQVRIAGKKGLNTVYCFIEFADASQAYSALAMNGLPVGDRQIRVSMAKTGLSQPSGPSSPAPLPPYEMLQAQAQAHMMNGSGYMMQPNMGPMQPNLGPMPGMPPGMMPLPPMPPPGPKPHRRPHQDPTKVHRTVYLENVAADIDEQVLAEYFAACGDVVAVRLGEKTVPQQLTIKAWIEFQSQHAARTAREYDQTMLQGSAIRVRPSKTAIHTNGLAPPRLTPNSSPGRPSQSLHNLPLDSSHSPPPLPHQHNGSSAGPVGGSQASQGSSDQSFKRNAGAASGHPADKRSRVG